MSIFILVLFFGVVYFVTQSSFKQKPNVRKQLVPTSAPSLLRAWCRSAAWALGCSGSCVLLKGWADENHAFESGSQGQGQLAVLLLAVVIATVLFHAQVYKKFQRVYIAWVAGWPPDSTDALAKAWLIAVGLLRAGWVVAVLLLVLCVLIKDSPADAGWR